MEITEFSIFGSCTSRTIFNSRINKDYKKYFKINKSVESSNLISLMSKPIEYDINAINSDSKYDNICVNDDLSKSFLRLVESDTVDYIIIDTLFDVSSKVLFYDEDHLITLNGRLIKTDFYESVKNKRSINIFDNFEEYYSLWTDACNRFFEFVESNCSHTKIILNCSRSIYEYLDENGNIVKNAHFERVSNKFNPFQNLLDKYILKNFDVEVLKFNPNTLGNAKHVFGMHPSHFEEKYYLEKNQQMLDIIDRNDVLNFYDDTNVYMRQKKREELIELFELTEFDFENNSKFAQNKGKINDTIDYKLKKYNTARIDIKNSSPENQMNSIKINNYSDFNLSYYYPDWFKDSKGKGLLITSEQNFLKFDILVEGDGELRFYLRSVDYRLKGSRIPIYINYTKFNIDNKEILTENQVVHHNEPYVYKLNVSDGQKLSIYLEWIPY